MTSIPVYTIQSAPLPTNTCEDIDRRCRRFLWGSNSDSRKVHLVNWQDMRMKKEDRGLGLKGARAQNDTFMMKLGWGMIMKRDALKVVAVEIISKVNACAVWANGGFIKGSGRATNEEVWKPPDEGFVKVNVDGACSVMNGSSAYGRFARDCKGAVLGGFMCKIGEDDGFKAETWGVLWGLKRAWDLGFRHVIIELDCLERVEGINRLGVEDPSEAILVEIAKFCNGTGL